MHFPGCRMGPAGIAAAVLLSSSPALKNRKTNGRNKRSQSRSPERGPGAEAHEVTAGLVQSGGIEVASQEERRTSERWQQCRRGWRQPEGGTSRLICASMVQAQTSQ